MQLGAIGSFAFGVGLTIASAFAVSLGLSVTQQRIGFAAGVVLMCAGAALFFVGKGRPAAKATPPMDSGSITTYNQSGGINVTGGVHITAPRPSVEIGQVVENEKTGNGYLTTVNIFFKESYAAQNLVVVGSAPSLKIVNINRVGGGVFESFGLTVDGRMAVGVERPQSDHYRAFLLTGEPEHDLKVEVLLNVDVRKGS